ncbi:MAG: hypothetical protein ABI353_01575 [Isosphaeraceae bacterium]
MNRRDYLRTTSALLGWSVLTPAGSPSRAEEVARSSYENNLRDRLWMWGHDSGVYDGADGPYNIPLSAPISMADGIKSMGIPNVCVIRDGTPDAEYREQFRDVKRVAWKLSAGSNESYRSLKQYVFGLRDTMPNLTGYYLDDFFRFGDRPNFDRNSETEAAPAALSLEEMEQLHAETLAYRRRLELSIVLYTHLLCPAIKPVLRYADIVSLWIWNGAHIEQIDADFRKYRSLAPDKPTLLGIYMWDFGGRKELSERLMAQQLDYALKLYKEGQIEGMIFHCTPLCNKGLTAVDHARDWIARHGDEIRKSS